MQNIKYSIIPDSLGDEEFDGIVQFLVQPTKGQEDRVDGYTVHTAYTSA